MRRSIAVVCAVAALSSLVVPSASAAPLTPEALAESVAAELGPLRAIYEKLHAEPELSYREERTAAYLTARMKELGFDVTERVGRYEDAARTSYGLVAVMTNGDGPTVLVRTDLDALPIMERTGLPYASTARATGEGGEEVPVMHACGHDLHMTVWLGTARMLAENRRSWSGTLVMIGQPAEERGAGAKAMLADRLYERFGKPDFALALHDDAAMPAGSVGVVPGYALANVDSVDVTVKGEGGHGAYPHTTIDPIVISSRIVLALQTLVSREVSPLSPAVVTVGSIHGGTKHNVIPDEVRLQLTVRSYEPEVRRTLLDGIRRTARGIAASAGVPEDKLPQVHVSEDEFTPTTYNDPRLTERLTASFARWLGEERIAEKGPVMGGEDFGRYTLADRSVPAVMFWLGAVDPEVHASGAPLPSLHSPLFAPSADLAISTGVIAMTGAVLDLLQPLDAK